MKEQLHAFLVLALDVCEWLASHSGYLTLEERNLVPNEKGGWTPQKNLAPLTKLKPGHVD
jgi:hypothetical protein